MNKILGLVVALSFLSVPAALAGDASGCGLGQTLFEGKKGMVNNVLAATTNGISGNQTFGMTSGTSGCDADSVVKKDHEQEIFVATNLDNLSQDMAQGGGQYLHALSGLMGCDAAAYGALTQLSQDKYEVMFVDADVTAGDVLFLLKREMAAHATLNASCSRVS